MDTVKLTLADCSAVLVEPSPLASLAISGTEDDLAASVALMAAAMAVSWPLNRKFPAVPPPVPWTPSKSIVDYGGCVYDGVRRYTRGKVTLHELHIALRQAYQWCSSHLLTEEEVQATEDFSVAPEGA